MSKWRLDVIIVILLISIGYTDAAMIWTGVAFFDFLTSFDDDK